MYLSSGLASLTHVDLQDRSEWLCGDERRNGRVATGRNRCMMGGNATVSKTVVNAIPAQSVGASCASNFSPDLKRGKWETNMAKTVEIHGHDVEIKLSSDNDGSSPSILIKNSKIDYNAQPEKVKDLLDVLGLEDNVSVEMRVTTASTIVE